MRRRHAELVLWLLALAFFAAGWRRWRAAELRPPAGARGSIPAAGAPGPPLSPDTLREAARVVTSSDPFRLDRAPAPLAAQPALPPGTPPPPPPPPPFRPQLAVSGIVGPPWQAILEGVPEQAGSVVVRPGERLGRLRVRSIDHTTVIVEGPDTTWRLTVRNP